MSKYFFYIYLMIFSFSSIFAQDLEETQIENFQTNKVKGTLELSSGTFQVAYTSANEKSPFIAGTNSKLYVVSEYTEANSTGPIKIAIYESTDNGNNWTRKKTFSTSTQSLVLPQAFVENNYLYVSYQQIVDNGKNAIKVARMSLSDYSLEYTTVEYSSTELMRPSIIANGSTIYVAYADKSNSKFIIAKGTSGGTFSKIYSPTNSFTYPDGLFRTDATNGSGTDMFVYNAKISGSNKIIVLARTGTSSFTKEYEKSISSSGASPTIGSYGGNWIVGYSEGTTIKYFYKLSGSVSSEKTLTTSAKFPVFDMTDSPSGYIAAAYVKNSRIYSQSSSVAQISTWSPAAQLYTDNYEPSSDDFISMWPSNTQKGVVFANKYAANDYDIFYTPMGSELPFLNVNPPTIDFPNSNPGSDEFAIASNVSWTVNENATWLSVNPGSGSYNDDVTVTVTENTNTSPRSATITISANGVSSKTVTVNQPGKSVDYYLNVPSSPVNFPWQGGTETKGISSNVSWSVSESADWLTVSPVQGTNNGNIQITASQNNSTSSKSATITISGSNGVPSVQIPVTIEGKPDGPGVSVDIPSGIIVSCNNEFLVPINTADLTGKGVISFQFTLNFNPNLIEAVSVEQSGTILPSGWSIIPNINNSAGSITIAAAGASEISGSGILLNIKFKGKGTEGTSSLTLNNFQFNSGVPTAIVTNGSVNLVCKVCGDVSVDGSVNAYDAALILRHTVGLITLNADQQNNGDINEDNNCNAYDAALILRKVVGLSVPSPNCFGGKSNDSYNQPTINQSDLSYKNVENILSLESKIPQVIHSLFLEINGSGDINIAGLPADAIIEKNNINGTFKIAMATASGVNLDNIKIIGKEGVSNRIDKLILNNSEISLLNLSNNSPVNEYTLYDAYPNPFNPKTNIKFSIPEDSFTVVKIFDLLGREMKTLLSEELMSGTHQLVWDGTNNFGEQVSTGIYILNLRSNLFSSSIKLNLIK
ncbi:MAG: hypothetical protein CMF23_00630 [Ignavibacteriae bacterium]|nr:hypothetical protein [Ignavibacteriota bacterium]